MRYDIWCRSFGRSLVLGLVAATGLGAVLQASTHLLAVLKIAGGDYLLWLAYGSAFSAIRVASEKPVLNDTAQSAEKRFVHKEIHTQPVQSKGSRSPDGSAVS